MVKGMLRVDFKKKGPHLIVKEALWHSRRGAGRAAKDSSRGMDSA